MRYLFVTARYLTSKPYLCRLTMLYFIVASIKLLRSLNSENFDEYYIDLTYFRDLNFLNINFITN